MKNDNLQNETLPSTFEDGEIDLAQYLSVIRRSLLKIITLALTVTLLTVMFVLTLTPRFLATATLLIESEQTNLLSIEEVYGLDSSRKEYFETQYEILRSRKIARQVVEELALHEYPEYDFTVLAEQQSFGKKLLSSVKTTIKDSLPFLPKQEVVPLSAADMLEARVGFATDIVMRNLNVAPVNKTQVVQISFESANRETAALVANTVSDVYIESYLASKLEMTTKATTWLNESLQNLQTKLDVAEANLSAFYEEEQLVDIDGVMGLSSENLQRLNEGLTDAQAALQRNETIYQQVNSSNASIEELASIPEVLNHQSIQNIRRELVLAQSNVSELSEVYGLKHPKMISANAELSSMQRSLLAQVEVLVSGITNEFRSSQLKVEALQSDIDQEKAEFRKLNSLENQRRALQREVDINQQLYDSFFTRLKETDEIGGFESANARVLDAATIPTSPSKPRKTLITIAAFIFSIGLGSFLAIGVEVLNSGIRSNEDVEKKLSQRMLGIIPWQAHKKNESLSLRVFFDKTHHSFSESVRTLRTSLQLLNLDRPSKTILVTSSVPKEGKSTVSVNLAFAMGQLSKVLVLDTDLRRPTIGKLFELPRFQPGLANLIAKTHTLDECLVSDEQTGVDIICAGTIPPNPQELLASIEFKKLVNELKEKYDHIILDSAPTQAVSDSVLVSKVCDSVIYVVRADSTSHKVINQGLSRFMQIGHRVDGVVLNQVDLHKANKTGAYSGFYDQYGYNSYSDSDKSV